MTVISTIAYYMRRASEAPLRITLEKMAIHVRRQAFRTRYRRMRPLAPPPQAADGDARILAAVTLGGSLAALLDAYAAQDQEFAQRGRLRALQVKSRNFPCLGFGDVAIPRGPDWQADPIHGYRWPNAYFADVDFAAAGIRCDVKIPWELSRQQYLLWLAEGSLFAAPPDPECRVLFVAIVKDWIRSNPPGFGVNWCCAMEVGIRAINLVLAFALFSAEIDEEFAHEIVRSVAEHKAYIERFPEISDVPGNHYLADLAGAVFASIFETERDPTAFDDCIRQFAEEADRQFETEGGHRERAPLYHRLCLDMAALVLAVALRFDHPECARLQSILERGVAFCRDIGSFRRTLPVMGDADGGHILWFGQDPRDFTALEEFAAALHSPRAPTTSDFARWLRALAGIGPAEAEISPIRPFDQTKSLQRSGYAVACLGHVKAVMRVGAQGLEGRASHDHDDALSIWLSNGDRDLIVEEGCHSYTADRAIRIRNTGSPAHNLVQPAGWQRFGGTRGSVFLSMRGAPTARREASNGREPAIDAVLDCRGLQHFGACRRRLAIRSPVEIEIVDEWTWRTPQPSEARWHFGPGLTLRQAVQAIEIVDEMGDTVMTAGFTADVPFRQESFVFDFSPNYGGAIACQGLSLVFAGAAAVSVRTIFALNGQPRWTEATDHR